jgi:hypothetical protein
LEVDMVAAAVIGGAVIGAGATAYSGSKAANAQGKATDAGVAESRYEFDEAKKILSPYVEAGTGSLTAQQDMLGLNGPEAQQRAIDGVSGSPEFASLTQQGEEAILQNASATGGVRGGNTQAALAQFRPQLLQQLLSERFAKLGSITQTGQASAAGQASAGIQTGSNIASLLQAGGAAKAGGYLAQGQAIGQIGNGITQAAILNKVF